jgi:hypothetical protein
MRRGNDTSHVLIRWVNAQLFVSIGVLATSPNASAAHDPKRGATASSKGEDVERLPEVVIEDERDNMVGIADAASQGRIDGEDLRARPLSRTGEVLESVPGVIVTQHAGGGKANQFFLRGFNLDHGTDFATTLDGMPLNLVSHGHGQGYTDLNPVIPELIAGIDFRKGVYGAAQGDFSSAGSADITTQSVLPASFATISGGMFGMGRVVVATSPKLGKTADAGTLLMGAELLHHDGPWDIANNFRKTNLQVTYRKGADANGVEISLRMYRGVWNSSDQVAQGAVQSGQIERFGTLDPTTGGEAWRSSFNLRWKASRERDLSQFDVSFAYAYLDLFSNFTYFLNDPVRGDQFEQNDRRLTSFAHFRHTRFWDWKAAELTLGASARNDVIENGLFQTMARQRLDKFDVASGQVLPARTRSDFIVQSSVGVYVENRMWWTTWLRSTAGVRSDLFHFSVEPYGPHGARQRASALTSPKASLIFGPWWRSEIYLQAGMGFHSNDARGVVGNAPTETTSAGDRAVPLVRTRGVEIGLRCAPVRGLRTTLNLWALDLDSELVFVGDAGTTEANRSSRRYGIEWSSDYAPRKDIRVDFDVSFSHARFRDFAPEGEYIPGAIERVVAAGFRYLPKRGLFVAPRLRYFGSRPLTEDNSWRSKPAWQVSAAIGYEFDKTWTVTVEGFNLLNRRDHDIDYAYESRVAPDAAAQMDRHFHPMEPLRVQANLRARF